MIWFASGMDHECSREMHVVALGNFDSGVKSIFSLLEAKRCFCRAEIFGPLKYDKVHPRPRLNTLFLPRFNGQRRWGSTALHFHH